MPHVDAFTSPWALSLLLASSLFTGVLAAQTAAPVAIVGAPTGLAPNVTLPVVQGKTNAGQAFNLSSLKGKLVLVMFWSTDCAVCRDKMPELRENYKGWAGKPFELVLVSVDRRMKDVDDYEAIINRMVPMQQRFVQLWTGNASYKDNLNSVQLQRTQLPASFLVDKTGKIIERYNGRIPAEVWDTIADLL